MEARNGASYSNGRIKGGPFRSKYRETSLIWRQNDLIISKRKVRATCWCKNTTNYANKIRRYLRRKIGNCKKVSLPFLSFLEQGSLLPDSGRACCRVHAPSLGNANKRARKIFVVKVGEDICLTRKNIIWADSVTSYYHGINIMHYNFYNSFRELLLTDNSQSTQF